MNKNLLISVTTIIMLSLNINVSAQKEISIDDIYKTGSFRVNGIYGISSMNDGLAYTNLNSERNKIIKYSYKSGEELTVIFNEENHKIQNFDGISDYEFNSDESKILICTQSEAIYRHSFKAEYYIYDILKNTITKLSDNGKQQLASFSPNGKYVAFVRDNNIFVKDITNENTKEIQITNDGEWNKIINGAPDWVYEEEFSYSKAYCWSNDSKKIAFLKSDESNVKMFSFPVYGGNYPQNYEYKYPKAGEENSKVSLHIADINTQNIIQANLGNLDDIYIPRILFTKDENTLAAIKMNRLQNKYELFLINTMTGSSNIILTLNDPKYIEINDDLTFLNDKKRFILTHEASGYNHIYLYNIDGKLEKQITSGDWEVTAFYGIDESNGNVYFQAAKTSALNKEIYSTNINKNTLTLLSEKTGINNASFSNSFKYFINNFSDANTPAYITLNDNKGKKIRELESNSELLKKINEEYKFSKKEFFTFKTDDGNELNGWIIKPAMFDSSKKYPVFMYVYGGPGSQTVSNSWDRDMPWWQLLAQKGYIVVSVDNRGTGARGKDFRQATYKQLGKYEVSDQIEAAKYLGTLNYIDKNRIGIFGWSYGGYMATLCMTIGAEYFKLGIAVAPVTNWRYYDSVYTERYNGLPQNNAEGYDENSPIFHVNKMKGKYLLVHGTADDNVHFQNSVDIVSKLVDANVQFESFYYPNKNHSIYGGNTRYHLYTKMTDFILGNL